MSCGPSWVVFWGCLKRSLCGYAGGREGHGRGRLGWRARDVPLVEGLFLWLCSGKCLGKDCSIDMLVGVA